jgi:hypothetical protein
LFRFYSYARTADCGDTMPPEVPDRPCAPAGGGHETLVPGAPEPIFDFWLNRPHNARIHQQFSALQRNHCKAVFCRAVKDLRPKRRRRNMPLLTLSAAKYAVVQGSGVENSKGSCRFE